MSEPQFIRNSAPHEVSMPEGSKVAMSKTADVGEPVVRQVLADSEPFHTDLLTVEPDALLVEPIETENDLRLAMLKKPTIERHLSSENISENTQQELTLNFPEMNFPARIIHLKIENDKVRAELMTLEQQFLAGT